MQSQWETNLIAKIYAPHFTEKQRILIEETWLREAITEDNLVDEALISILYSIYIMFTKSKEERMYYLNNPKDSDPLCEAVEDGLIDDVVRAKLQSILDEPRTIHSMKDIEQLANHMEQHCANDTIIRDTIMHQYLDEICLLQAIETRTEDMKKLGELPTSSIIKKFAESQFDQKLLEAYLTPI